MKRQFLMLLALLSAAAVHAAGDEAAKSAYEAAKKAADNRYSEDRMLCADESSSARRMQCLRDAKEEYTRALAAAGKQQAEASMAVPDAAVCKDCGRVSAIRMSEKDGAAGPVGVIAGGLAGALLGHQVGKGTGKDLATIAGAAGGAYAGHTIEGKMNKIKTWAVSVRFDNGEERVFNFDHDPAMAAGDPVKISGGSIVRR